MKHQHPQILVVNNPCYFLLLTTHLQHQTLNICFINLINNYLQKTLHCNKISLFTTTNNRQWYRKITKKNNTVNVLPKPSYMLLNPQTCYITQLNQLILVNKNYSKIYTQIAIKSLPILSTLQLPILYFYINYYYNQYLQLTHYFELVLVNYLIATKSLSKNITKSNSNLKLLFTVNIQQL